MEVKNAFSPGGPAYVSPPDGASTMNISSTPPEPGRNLLNPHLPGTRAFTERVNAWEPPNPLTTKASENYMYDVGAVAPIAYHGTPHKFDKFDVSKIGTGQGAQSYGHGLYFAENPKVAGEYMQQLAPKKTTIRVPGEKPIIGELTLNKNEREAARTLRGYGGDYEQAINAATMMEKYPGVDPYIDPTKIRKTLNEWKSKGATLEVETPGKTLKVDIKPSADKFLDWDKPLSEQPKSVVDQLRKAGLIDKEGYVGSLSGAKHIDDITGDDLHAIIKEQYANNYGDKRLLSVKGKNADEAVSKYLNDLGIPGIRYLDQGSRGAGKGTYNYVVFSDKDVEILK